MNNQRKPITDLCPYCGKENKISFLNYKNYFFCKEWKKEIIL